jgi:hypothetical protein
MCYAVYAFIQEATDSATFENSTVLKATIPLTETN